MIKRKKRLTKINLIFDNNEIATIPINCVSHFSLGTIEKWFSNAGDEFSIARCIKLSLFSEVNELATTPFNVKLADRLSEASDIASLELIYNDGAYETIFVDWDNKNNSDESNALQQVAVGKDDNAIYITIGRGVTIANSFKLEELELLAPPEYNDEVIDANVGVDNAKDS